MSKLSEILARVYGIDESYLYNGVDKDVFFGTLQSFCRKNNYSCKINKNATTFFSYITVDSDMTTDEFREKLQSHIDNDDIDENDNMRFKVRRGLHDREFVVW